jgi:hypothetical protein
MLKDFIQAQMWYFSKGLESLSKAYQAVEAIDEGEDMKELDLLQRAYTAAQQAAMSPATLTVRDTTTTPNRNSGKHHAHKGKKKSTSGHHHDPDGEEDVRRDGDSHDDDSAGSSYGHRHDDGSDSET